MKRGSRSFKAALHTPTTIFQRIEITTATLGHPLLICNGEYSTAHIPIQPRERRETNMILLSNISAPHEYDEESYTGS